MYPLQIHQRCTAIVLNNRKCIESFCKVEVMFGSAVVQQAINFVMWKHCTRAIARDDSIDTELEVTIYINYINKQQSIQRTATPLHPLQQNALAAVAGSGTVTQFQSSFGKQRLSDAGNNVHS